MHKPAGNQLNKLALVIKNVTFKLISTTVQGDQLLISFMSN